MLANQLSRLRTVFVCYLEVLLRIELLPVEHVELREPCVIGKIVPQKLVGLNRFIQHSDVTKETLEVFARCCFVVQLDQGLHQCCVLPVSWNGSEDGEQRLNLLAEHVAELPEWEGDL